MRFEAYVRGGPQADEEEFFMVWKDGGDVPRKRHETLASAQAEAERLANNHPGFKFYVLRAIESAESMRVVRKRLVEGVPF